MSYPQLSGFLKAFKINVFCENCKKWYDYSKEEFCPRCGAFNQPVKTWGTDSQGNIIRLNGGKERTPAVRGEAPKSVRRPPDRSGAKPSQPRQAVQPPRQPRPLQRPQPVRKQEFPARLKILFWFLAIALLINFILPLLMALL